jgi:hypothetical protein
MVHGSGGGYVGNVPNNTRVGIPPINLEDGPQGVADGVSAVTCWPSALTNVMSWNTTAMYLFGQAMAQEQYLKGTNVMLGPGVNIVRRRGRRGLSFAPPQTSHSHTPTHSLRGLAGPHAVERPQLRVHGGGPLPRPHLRRQRGGRHPVRPRHHRLRQALRR